jgi:hypothetical protein
MISLGGEWPQSAKSGQSVIEKIKIFSPAL